MQRVLRWFKVVIDPASNRHWMRNVSWRKFPSLDVSGVNWDMTFQQLMRYNCDISFQKKKGTLATYKREGRRRESLGVKGLKDPGALHTALACTWLTWTNTASAINSIHRPSEFLNYISTVFWSPNTKSYWNDWCCSQDVYLRERDQ